MVEAEAKNIEEWAFPWAKARATIWQISGNHEITFDFDVTDDIHGDASDRGCCIHFGNDTDITIKIRDDGMREKLREVFQKLVEGLK